MVMSDSVLGALQPELKSGERVLWSGMPRQGVRLQPGDAQMIPFSLFWGGFAVFWEYGVITEPHAPIYMAVWGVPFILIGLYMIVGRFFYDAYRRAHTYYAVTDQRIIIVAGVRTVETKSLFLDNPAISLSVRPDGSGTILFGSGMATYAVGLRGRGSAPRVPSFDMIEDARKVYDLILNTRDKKTI